jgi:putative DNA primase/helicase
MVKLMAVENAESLRYVQGTGWYVWDGTAWKPDPGRVQVAEMVDQFVARKLEDSPHGDERAAFLARGRLRRYQNFRPMNDVLGLMERSPEFSGRADRFEQASGWISTAAGYHYAARGEPVALAAPRYSLYLRHHIPLKPTPYAGSLWDRFVTELVEGDLEKYRYLQRAAGYSMLGWGSEQVFFFLQGPGGNGKSTFTRAIRTVLGESLCSTLSGQDIITGRNERAVEIAVAKVANKRFVVGEDIPAGTLNLALLKALSGGELMQARALYQTAYDIRAKCVIWLGGNDYPRVRESADGIWRRLRLIPCGARPAVVDTLLPEKLATPAEQAAILGWLLEGAAAWADGGLGVLPDAATEAAEQYRAFSDPLREFVNERTAQAAGCRTPGRDVYDAYVAYCGEQGMDKLGILSPNGLGRKLSALGWISKVSNSVRYWVDRRLIDLAASTGESTSTETDQLLF